MMTFDPACLLENAAWPALLVDAAGEVLWANPGAQLALGLAAPPPAGTPALASRWAASNACSFPEFMAKVQRTALLQATLANPGAGGGETLFRVSACPVPGPGPRWLLQLFRDEPRTTAAGGEGRAQRYETALRLIRTVALDINNALTGILGHSSLLLGQMPADDPRRAGLVEIERAVARAAQVAGDLGSFGFPEKPARDAPAGNLNAAVQRAIDAFRQSHPGPASECAVQFETGLFAARCDEARLRQAVLLLLQNAAEARPDGARIQVRTRNLELSGPTQDRGVTLAQGAYVCIEVADNGPGIPPEVLPRIFEPFFTTKTGVNHRGLGLAMVYGIVANCGGGVAVSSEPGNGASFRLYLPAERRPAGRGPAPAVTNLNGHETVLVVDDDDLVLRMAEKALATHGYRTLTAATGEKALELLNRPGPKIDLMITDLVMPGMSGGELAEHAGAFVPSLRILCTSGRILPLPAKAGRPYLQKPFTCQELLARVRQTLERG